MPQVHHRHYVISPLHWISRIQVMPHNFCLSNQLIISLYLPPRLPGDVLQPICSINYLSRSCVLRVSPICPFFC
jgi:hypothetical protein